MSDALIRLIAQDLMSGGFIAAGKSAEDLEGRMVDLTSEFERSSKATKESEEVMNGYAKMIGGTVLAATAALAAGVVALTSAYQANAIEAQKQATMAGTTVEAFSTIKGAAEDVGVSGSTVQHALTIMQRGMQAGGEQGETFKAQLKSLGVETEQYKNSATGTTDILLALQAQFSKMPDGPEKTAAAMKVFGRGGAEMLEFLNQNTAALEDNMAGFRDLGLTVTAADVEIARGMRDAKNNMMDLFEASTTAIGRGMGPMFLETMTAIGGAADQVFHAVVDQFGGVKGATESLTETMTVLRPAVAAIGPATSVAIDAVRELAPVATVAFDVMRGGAIVVTGLATALSMAVSGWYELKAAAYSTLGASDETIAGIKKTADHAADLAERFDATTAAIVRGGDAADIAGPKMLKASTESTVAIKKQEEAINAGGAALKKQGVAASEASQEIVKLTMADLDGTTKATTAKKEQASVEREHASERRAHAQDFIKLEEEKKKATEQYYAKSLNLRQVELGAMGINFEAEADANAKRAKSADEWAKLQERSIGLCQSEGELIRINSSAVIDHAKAWSGVLAQCERLPGVMQEIAAGTEKAAQAAAGLSAEIMRANGAAANIYDGVNAIGSKTGTAAQGGLSGGPTGTYATTTFGNYTATSRAAEGSMAMFSGLGVLGQMQAAADYQKDIEKAFLFDKFEKEQAALKDAPSYFGFAGTTAESAEPAVINARIGGGGAAPIVRPTAATPALPSPATSGANNDLVQELINRRSARYAGGTGLAGVPGYGSGDMVPALLTPGEIVLSPEQSDAMRMRAALDAELFAKYGPGNAFVEPGKAAPVETAPRSASSGGRGGGSSMDDLPARIAAAVRDALAGVSVTIDGREIGKLLLRQTRNGQAVIYGPAGSTTAR